MQTRSVIILAIWRLEVFTAVGIQVAVFWVVTPCSVVTSYPPVEKPCTLKKEAAGCSEMLASNHTTRSHNPEDLDFGCGEENT
jgi:hypothetical protein